MGPHRTRYGCCGKRHASVTVQDGDNVAHLTNTWFCCSSLELRSVQQHLAFPSDPSHIFW
eukprot:4002316-Amphidinium_carterae.1